MKKIYILSLLCCLGLAAFSQTTVTIWSHALAGTYTTGNASSTGVRTDNAIVATGAATAKRGYAVFDLSTIPAGSQITAVTAGFYVNAVVAGTITTTTYAYAGDLSTVAVPATLYADMVAGTVVSAVAYTAGVGVKTVVSTAPAVAFAQANIGSKISYCYTNTGTYSFTITGETGLFATPGLATDAPYLTITYCPPPTVVTATATPGSLCQGAVLGLGGTGAAAGGGSLTWSWTGPAGFTSTLINPTLTTLAGSSGVYSLTVTNTCASGAGTASAVTSVVTVNPTPSAITGGPVCTGGTVTLSSIPGGGTWSSSLPGIASVVAGTGLLSGVAPGSTTITYTSPAGCVNTGSVTDNDPPGAISGLTSVCIANSILLSDGMPGGSWSDDGTGIVTTVAGTGSVTGNIAGTAVVYYTTGGCVPASYTVTVTALPSAITGPSVVCAGSSITLTDTDPGGTWSSSNITMATTGSTGVVNGVAAGSLNILYTDPASSCHATYPITVNAMPAAITGASSVCSGSSITLTDITTGGTFSGSGTFGTVAPGGLVTGVGAGIADVTYTVAASGCDVATTVTINPLPAAINTGAGIVCQGVSITYTDTDPGGIFTSASTAIATVGVVSGSVTGTGAGITSIIYTLGTGCSITAPVTVQAAPVSVITAAGPTTFCAGGSVVLNGSVGAGYTYQWNRGGVPLSGSTSVAYNASITGPYTLTITNTLGCQTTSAAVNVVDGITGTIINATPLSFCNGQDVILTASTGSVTGTITYQWKLNTVSIGGATNVTYAAVASGSYTCYITISGGAGSCPVLSDSVLVTVHPLPTPPISYTGSVLTTTSGYSGYQWYENTVSVSGANSNIYYPASNGSYKVLVTDGHNCSGFSPAFALTNVGVKELNKQPDIVISPNPASSVLHIESAVPVRIIIAGLEGKVYYDQVDAKDINISNFANGLYIITAYDINGNRLAVKKFIKE